MAAFEGLLLRRVLCLFSGREVDFKYYFQMGSWICPALIGTQIAIDRTTPVTDSYKSTQSGAAVPNGTMRSQV